MEQRPVEQTLVKLEFIDESTPPEGSVLLVEGRFVGRLTSSRYSPVLGRGIGLAWLRQDGGRFPDALDVGTTQARVVAAPFYDPEGARPRA
jgi:aminomethyltransferase